MTQYQRLLDAYNADVELPTLTASEFAALILEVKQDDDISFFDKTEILESGRFFGRGFAVDYSTEE